MQLVWVLLYNAVNKQGMMEVWVLLHNTINRARIYGGVVSVVQCSEQAGLFLGVELDSVVQCSEQGMMEMWFLLYNAVNKQGSF